MTASHFQEWAKSNSSRQSIEDGMLYAYYGKQLLSYYQNLSVGNTQCKNPYYGPHGNICHSINNWIYILEMFTICTVSALYSSVVMFVFLILPFCYFFYEEGDDDVTTKSVSNYVWIKFSKKMYWNWLTDRNWCLQKWVSLSLSQIKKKNIFG